ncbi:hypothetical protein L4D15_24245 [Enterovibrio norvegicus]|uniref:hypothetical protein n=1 Tax=Enterovibrio norvegicus TaxID=188144 RepID=UPI003D0EEB2B
MGTTFVSINKKGFWLRDRLLELWLCFAALHIEDSPEENSEAHKIRDQWLVASRGAFTGCVPDGLDEAVSTESGKEIVVSAISSLLKELKQAPDELDKDVLNLMGSFSKFAGNVETFRLVEISQAVLDLIEGKVGTDDASDTSFMPGCR